MMEQRGKEGGRIRGRSEKLRRRGEGVIIFNIILLLRFLALFYSILYCTIQYNTIQYTIPCDMLCYPLFNACQLSPHCTCSSSAAHTMNEEGGVCGIDENRVERER
jgi:hypothetical protein